MMNKMKDKLREIIATILIIGVVYGGGFIILFAMINSL